MFTRNSRVEYRERADVAVATQRQRVVGSVFAPGAQRKHLVKVPMTLLRVVDLHVEAGKQVLLSLNGLGDAHSGAKSPL